MKHKFVVLKKQAGVTLMELIASLAIIALVIVGALALYTSASSSEAATSLTRDLHAIQAATQQLFQGQGSYGASGTNLNSILVTAKKIPNSISVSTSSNPPVLNHKLNGTVNVVSTGSSFTITLTNIPTEVCMPLMTAAAGWRGVKAGTAAERTSFPISPATAEADCKTGTTMVFTN